LNFIFASFLLVDGTAPSFGGSENESAASKDPQSRSSSLNVFMWMGAKAGQAVLCPIEIRC
jgi:hypothetical protein